MYDNYPGMDSGDELDNLDREIRNLTERRKELARSRLMDAKDERLVDLAYESGLARGQIAGLKNEVRAKDKEIEELISNAGDYRSAIEARNRWEGRALAAEKKLERAKKRSKK